MARRKNNDNKMNDYLRDTGFNQRTLEMLAAVNNGELVDPDDVDTMQKRYTAYLNYCMENDMPISNLTAYRAIGITKQQVDRWLSGAGFTNKRRKAFLEQVIADCGAYRESAMLEGKIPVPSGIFWQKNFDGLRDVSETIVHVDDAWNEQQSPEELQARYADVIDAEYTVKPTHKLTEKAESIQTINVSSAEEIPLETAETTSQKDTQESIKKEALNE